MSPVLLSMDFVNYGLRERYEQLKKRRDRDVEW